MKPPPDPKRAPDTPAHPHQRADYFTLKWFRDNGYATEIPVSPDSRGFAQVAPGKLKKVYSVPQKNLCYRVSRFRLFEWEMPGEKLRSPKEIAKGIDSRSLEELLPQATDALGQLLLRAAAGDETAMSFFIHRAYDLAVQLENLQKAQPDKLRVLAETYDRWPVLLSHNRQDIDYASERITKLHVGEKAFPPTGKGQKFGRASFWTRLAAAAVKECETAGHLVRILNETHLGNVTATKRITNKLWGASVEGTCYRLPADVILITDWEKECAGLSRPITDDNFAAWSRVVREFVREYWKLSKAAYRSALTLVDPRYEEKGKEWEWEFRDRAFTRLKHALQDLARIRR